MMNRQDDREDNIKELQAHNRLFRNAIIVYALVEAIIIAIFIYKASH
jgi:hypothetical protein